jgi:hypothetical protein
MVGYCAHVIALVYFLSHARFLDYFESASHLKEYVVNIKENDSPSKVYTRRLKRKKNSEKLGFKCTETAEIKKLKQSDANEGRKQTIEKTLDLPNNSENDKNADISAKKSVDSTEINKKKTLDLPNNSKNNNEFINKFKNHIIPWGGEISYKNKKIKVVNTCTIDYHLLSLWTIT